MRAEASTPRKKPLVNHRLIAEKVVLRAAFLDSADQALLQAVFDRGVTAAEFARAMGEQPRAMRRRVQRLVERLGSNPYQFVMRQIKDWPPCQQRVAESVFLKGLSHREASQHLGMSLHKVRREVERIRSLYDSYQRQDSL